MLNYNIDGNTDDGGNVDDSVGGITTIPFIISLWHISIPDDEDNYDGFSLRHIPILRDEDYYDGFSL